MNKFGEYGNAYIHCKALDNQTYYWLVKNMDVMQHDLGLFGKIEYVPFMTNTLWHDYPIVLNTVQNFGNQTTRDTDCQMVHTAVVRYLGYLERCLDGQLFTPSAILRVGFMRVLSFPIDISLIPCQ